MEPLITALQFAQYRNISKKMDTPKITECIRIAQETDLFDVLGGFLFDVLDNVENEDYVDLLNGSTFTANGEKYIQEGLKSYLADLTYSRYIMNLNQVQTPFGMQSKFTDDSEPVDRNTIRDMVKQNQQDAAIRFRMIDKYIRLNTSTFPRYCKGNDKNINTFSQKWTVIK